MKRPGLFAKTLGFMVVIFGVIATATSVLSGWQIHTQLTSEYESKALALAYSMARSDLDTILERDAAAVQSRIDQYLRIEGVAYVLVADDQGEVIAHTFTPGVPEPVADIVDLETRHAFEGGEYDLRMMRSGGTQYLHVAMPILTGLVGYVHIGMDMGLINGYIRSAIVKQQVITLVLFLASVGAAWAFVNRISRPLHSLRDYARRVARHDFSASIRIDSRDEVGDLAKAMNAMSSEIRDLVGTLEARVVQATSELQQAKDELEEKVVERTRELSRANIQLKIEVAERKVVGEALRKTEQKYRSIFENAVEGIYQVGRDGHFISANPSLARIYGFTAPADFMATANTAPDSLFFQESRRDEFYRTLETEGELQNFESRVRRADGRVIWISENARRISDANGRTLYYEGSVEDITLRKEAEDQLMHQAFHDPLTNLPNRLLFQDHLQMALERSRRRDNYFFAVLYLDLDRFKIINDSLGHDIGDSLLRSVARVLVNCARGMDTVARFGGDEFAILLEEIAAPRDAIKIARRILDEISQAFVLDGNEVFTTASIGIVLHTGTYDRPEALLRDADTAMYRAKELGKSRFKVFNHRMHEQALHLMELETDLRKAVEHREFEALFQPVVCLDDLRIVGFEALVRWLHPQHGVISPDHFISLAEDTGLIYAIDQHMLETVCAQTARWRDRFADRFFDAQSPMTMALNFSGKHLKQPALLGRVEEALHRHNLDPHVVNLEITEHTLMDNPKLAGEMLAKLKDVGVGLCIDDFGTGYSSLSYLQRFPIDVVKIDRSFVTGMENDQDSRAIVQTVVSLGQALGLRVIAEGVESEHQLDILRQAGCRYAQGFLFSRPASAEQAEQMLESGGTLEHVLRSTVEHE
ncbi:PAS domain S-box-containing protein/diguanylate cyclase (GGDEF) domain-containing protein [Paucidesulfovibrio gracilis DSM 16080]|uniref:PAS domain S-box-containing protein/diguanylate cyclase (GGDEF) domain-containing protein n=1 Tax=Paucidesulfovibrio gracilis DSM 16080 TaxID=1121449 RepID=A0A1T4W5Z0_9BACT|nr:EAL domain-containing protein [Paucidesulfovibrio gracilis]SKA72468.1 PAS domain S-box-containing protein/diguanylate cyclase (GGDEF) domain-containing protein [Paucidesulfovibrio gracilis DSM 16080]